MTATQPKYVRMMDAPAMFGLSLTTIYRRVEAGAFPIYKTGAASLLKVADVEAWLDSCVLATPIVGAVVGAK